MMLSWRWWWWWWDEGANSLSTADLEWRGRLLLPPAPTPSQVALHRLNQLHPLPKLSKQMKQKIGGKDELHIVLSALFFSLARSAAENELCSSPNVFGFNAQRVRAKWLAMRF